MQNESWLSCLRRRGLAELCLSVECPAPCVTCDGELSCEDELRQLRRVYRQLLTTKRTVSIGDGDTAISYDYNPTTIAMLRDEIKDLNFRCGGTKSNTSNVSRPGPIRIGAPEGWC